MKKKLVVLSSLVLGSAPALVLAQGLSVSGAVTDTCLIGQGGNVFGLLCRIGQILNAIVPVLIALGIVYFVWGVITYMIAGDDEAKKKGRDKIIFGIIGLAVIVSVWGLVRYLTNTFNVDNTSRVTLPTVPIGQPR